MISTGKAETEQVRQPHQSIQNWLGASSTACILLGQCTTAMGSFLSFFSAGSRVKAPTYTQIHTDVHKFKFIDFAGLAI